MNNKEFLNAVKLVVKEKGINEDIIYEAMELALVSAYKKNFNSLENVKVKIDRVNTSSKYYNKPVVAYYNSTEAGSKESIKIAYVDSTTIGSGVDSNGYVTGNWEFMTVPSITAAQGGDPKFQNVCLDFNSTGKPIIGYLGDNLEFGTWCDE